ncbi:hypothetical protein ElyMa_006110300 [Elysia marginata]|uniref:Uncharacterized protein n=1 Tax=Elysia marginata TaxID=1093978 RepID=A0AAV4GTK2_9GAST|nr:hypothetical protein ElyMa_006110300 [Elysia marginata]
MFKVSDDLIQLFSAKILVIRHFRISEIRWFPDICFKKLIIPVSDNPFRHQQVWPEPSTLPIHCMTRKAALPKQLKPLPNIRCFPHLLRINRRITILKTQQNNFYNLVWPRVTCCKTLVIPGPDQVIGAEIDMFLPKRFKTGCPIGIPESQPRFRLFLNMLQPKDRLITIQRDKSHIREFRRSPAFCKATRHHITEPEGLIFFCLIKIRIVQINHLAF